MRPDRTAPPHCPSSEPVTEETLQVDLWFLQLLRRHAATVQRIVIDKYVVLLPAFTWAHDGKEFFVCNPSWWIHDRCCPFSSPTFLRCRDLSIVPVVEDECGSSEDECY